MHRFRALSLCSAALAAAAVSGCLRKVKRTQIVFEDAGIFTTDQFPGAPVQNGNTADDQRALSPQNQDFNEMKLTFNGDRGTAMITYSTFSLSGITVYSQYYDGEHWTPPVSLEATDVLFTAPTTISMQRVCHAYVNTADSDSAEAEERNGDCIIFWTAQDVDSDGAGPDGINLCLFATYFDSSEAWDPNARYGFQKTAVRLNVADVVGEDVTLHGLVTDGLCGEARWTSAGNNYRYGGATTGIGVAWRQLEDNNGGAPTDDAALHMVLFDLSQPGPSSDPLVPGADVRLPIDPLGASDSGSSSEETQVFGEFLATYNNAMIFRCGARNTSPGDDLALLMAFGSTSNNDNDETIQVLTVDLATGAVGTPAHLQLSTTITSTDTVDNRAQILNPNADFLLAGSVYGPDEGLATLVIFTCQLVEDAAGSFLGLTSNGRLCVAEVDPATGSVLDRSAVDAEDPLAADIVLATVVSTRISRNGDYIWIAWRERTHAGSVDNQGLWVAELATTRPAEDGTYSLPPLSDALSLPVNVNTDVDAQDVQWFMFQDGLGYVCGFQSDPDVMNLFYEQSDASFDQVNVVRLGAGLTFPCTPASPVDSVLETFQDGEMSSGGAVVNIAHTNFNAVDAGADGDIFAVYRKDVDPLPPTDYRLFAARTGTGSGSVEIDSNSDDRQVPSQPIFLVATPPGTDIGVYDIASGTDDESRPHGASYVHAIFLEDAISEVDGLGDALRTRQFYAGDGGSALADSFLPPVGTAPEEPFEISNPFTNPGVINAPTVLGTAVHDDLVGVWFREEAHVYYQECDPHDDRIGWRTYEGDSTGLSNPVLVDDSDPEDTRVFFAFATPGCTCRTLDSAMIFWTKTFDETIDVRLQVRVRYPVDR